MRIAVALLSTALLALPASTSAQAGTKGAPAPRRSDPRVIRADMSRIKGAGGAKTWILIASDFQCPFCKEFHDKTAKLVEKEFVETGLARMAYIHFPLRIHPNAMPAAEASMCAGAQDKFWAYHDRLFATVPRWSKAAQPAAAFVALARELKLNEGLFQQCLTDDVMLPMIQADYQRGVKAGVDQTPTFLIGDMNIPGNADITVIRGALREVLSKTK